MNLPVFDLHCDLLSYLQEAPKASPFKSEDIGCSFPDLQKGNVKLQVMAIYTSTQKGSAALGVKQGQLFKDLLLQHPERITQIRAADDLNTISTSSKLGVMAAIENASGFCEEDETLEEGFRKLENIICNTGRLLYIGLTHHGENRFGGGNNTRMGLKPDGRALLDYMNGKGIAVDLSHTSDALAFDILDHLSAFNLDIPVIASHSNFRKVFDHPRNLPDEIALEIIKRKGLIGINFLRAFINDKDPHAMYDHILHGIDLGGTEAICFGADYFYTASHPDPQRKPFFFSEHGNATCYPSILRHLSVHTSPGQVEQIANQNAENFMRRILAVGEEK